MAGPRLSNGVNDARKVAAALEGKGFEVERGVSRARFLERAVAFVLVDDNVLVVHYLHELAALILDPPMIPILRWRQGAKRADIVPSATSGGVDAGDLLDDLERLTATGKTFVRFMSGCVIQSAGL